MLSIKDSYRLGRCFCCAKVSTGHPHPLTSGALLNLTKYVGDDANIVPVICIVGFSSFVCRKIAASLHLMREVARRYAVTERENGITKFRCHINSVNKLN